MNLQRGHRRDEPEINLIPMIDVLLVILIFLMITTTYTKFSGLDISLPTADAPPTREQPSQIDVMVSASGEVLVDKTSIGNRDVAPIAAALKRAAAAAAAPVVVISADAAARHQRVVDVMAAAQQAGLAHIAFATQQNPRRDLPGQALP